MKNILKIVFTFCTALVVSSCVDDDKLFEISDFETGALPNLTPTTNDSGFINLTDLAGTTIEFTMDFSNTFEQSADGGITTGGSGKITTDTEFSPVSSVDLEVTYSNAVTGTIEKGSIMNIASWPSTVTLTVDDLIAAISSLSSTADLNVGDQFVFVNGINFTDGRAFPAFITDHLGNPVPNYSVNFNGSGNNPGFNFSLAYNVSCPSNIPTDGTWSAVNTGACAFGVCGSNTGITLTSLGNGLYRISDVTAGVYPGLCGGCLANQSVDFTDVCNSITIVGNNATQFTLVTDASNGFGSGTWDPVTETLTIPWFDSGNSFGNVSVFTRE